MILNFHGGIEATPELSVTMGCGCHCDCSRGNDSANGISWCEVNLECQPLPFFIFIWPQPI